MTERKAACWALAVMGGLGILLCAGCAMMNGQDGFARERWWKGNLHTHSYWSDGQDYPEMIADWYKEHGYDFLAISDHNVLAEGERWIQPKNVPDGEERLARYRTRFGKAVEERELAGKREVRLKTFKEYSRMLESPGRFLMIPAEEITDRVPGREVHVGAVNTREPIAPRGGATVREVLQNNINAVNEQCRRLGLPMLAHVNHPNFTWSLTAEDIAALSGEEFFEVYNGHPGVANHGDGEHTSTERMWDIILALRLNEPKPRLIYGIATDDAHQYRAVAPKMANPGRGWIMVRAPRLDAESLIKAMEKGDFYASTGVRLKDVRADRSGLRLRIAPEKGAHYRTQFIGTRRGANLASEPVVDAKGQALATTRHYGPAIGEVLAEVEGVNPGYAFRGDERYVRAVVRADKPQANATFAGDVESAWTQPALP